jgi:hypothetical protein
MKTKTPVIKKQTIKHVAAVNADGFPGYATTLHQRITNGGGSERKTPS